MSQDSQDKIFVSGSGVIKKQNVKSFKLVHDTYNTVQVVDKSQRLQ